MICQRCANAVSACTCLSGPVTTGPAPVPPVLPPMAANMTLRDYFAAKAMQGIIASLQEGEDFTDRGCEWAYKVAAAMMAEREKK